MPELPAFCSNCGAIFGSGYHVQAKVLRLSGNKSQCPVCGEMGEVPDGLYEATEDTLRLLSGPERTVNQLKRLARTLRDAQQQELTPDEIQAELDRNAPEFSKLGQILRKYAGKIGTVAGILSLILAVINTQIGKIQHQSQMDEHEETQEMSQEVLDQVRKCTTEEDIEDLMREIEDASPPDDTSNSKRQEKNN